METAGGGRGKPELPGILINLGTTEARSDGFVLLLRPRSRFVSPLLLEMQNQDLEESKTKACTHMDAGSPDWNVWETSPRPRLITSLYFRFPPLRGTSEGVLLPAHTTVVAHHHFSIGDITEISWKDPEYN